MRLSPSSHFFILLILTFTSILSGCGGSYSSNNTSPASTSPSGNMVSFNQKILTLTIDNTSAVADLGAGFPQVENTLIHTFGDYAMMYLQSDRYTAWQYRGEFVIDQQSRDDASLSFSIDSTKRNYQIDLDFSNENTGTWQGKFNDGNVTLTGSFTLESVGSPQDHNFQGEIIAAQTISSSITEVDYQYSIYLPPSYSQGNTDVPVIYTTDGQWEFWRFAQAIETSGKNIILVAITQGPAERRIIDYALPGAENYLEFLSQEFLPLIESQYRIDSDDRAIVGASWGGLIVRYALLEEVNNELFNKFISMDGSYWNEDSTYREKEVAAFEGLTQLNKKVYLSSATRAGNDDDVREYLNTLTGYQLQGLTVTFTAFEVEHGQITTPSIREALFFLYD